MWSRATRLLHRPAYPAACSQSTRFQRALQPHGRTSTFGWQPHRQTRSRGRRVPAGPAIWSTARPGPSAAPGAPSCWPGSSRHRRGTTCSSSDGSDGIWVVKVGHPEQRTFKVWLHWRQDLKILLSKPWKSIEFKTSHRRLVKWLYQNIRALPANFITFTVTQPWWSTAKKGKPPKNHLLQYIF